MNLDQSVVIVGDGLCATLLVAGFVRAERNVVWIKGTGARLSFPLSVIEDLKIKSDSRVLELWIELNEALGVAAGEKIDGQFLREFRNKCFREPAWATQFEPTLRKEIIEELFSGPEQYLVPTFETRTDKDFRQVEDALRVKLFASPLVQRIDYGAVALIDEIKMGDEGQMGFGVLLSSKNQDKVFKASQVFWADSLTHIAEPGAQLRAFKKLKLQERLRRSRPVSVLQVAFDHKIPVGAGLNQSFFIPLQRESEDEFNRMVWGSFSPDGKHSLWSLCLNADEIEDNHNVVRRLRRIRQALDKAIPVEFFKEAKPEPKVFTETLLAEQFRFEENFLFSSGEAAALGSFDGFHVLTDGFGPSFSMKQSFEVLDEFLGQKNQIESVEKRDSKSEQPA